MKCPVCERVTKNKKKCSNCGFDQLDKKFANDTEYLEWFNYTVKPCKAVYNKACIKYNSLKVEFSKSKKQLKDLSTNSAQKAHGQFYIENDVVYEDKNISVKFIKWQRLNYIFGGYARTATFLFENKSNRRLCIYMREISVNGFVNLEETQAVAFNGKQKGMNDLQMIYENKVPGNIDDFDSIEFVVCYENIGEGKSYADGIFGQKTESKKISLKL